MWSLILYGVMLLFLAYSIKDVKELGIKPLNAWDTLLALVVLWIMICLSFFISLIFYGMGFSEDVTKVKETIENVPLLTLLPLSIIGSIVEEMFFRGYIQRKTNLFMASFLFAYFHIIYGSFAEIVVAFVLGCLLGYSYQISKNLSVPILSHILFNLCMILLLV